MESCSLVSLVAETASIEDSSMTMFYPKSLFWHGITCIVAYTVEIVKICFKNES